MNETENQKKQIMCYMSAGYEITPREASRLFDCERLGARIWELRQEGVPIRDGWVYKRDEKGKVLKKWKKYWLA